MPDKAGEVYFSVSSLMSEQMSGDEERGCREEKPGGRV